MNNSFSLSQNNSVKHLASALLLTLFLLISSSAFAQFEAPEINKVTEDKRAWFMQQFKNMKWTGRGLYNETDLDDRQTNEIRARLQAVYGNPTQTIEDLINQDNFRPGKAIQFEYWFTVNDSIPMMVLDWDGPFGNGLTFVGASRYIDMMPQIKRTFARELMEVDELGNYQDYFYSPERQQWFNVAYNDGQYETKEISSPPGMSIDFSN